MRGSVKKSALILGVLLLSIAAAGQVFPGRDSQADVPVVTERVLVPGGQSVGVRMDVRGVLVVGLEEIENETGEKINPGLVSGLQIGDTILSINGTKVSSADEVQTLVNEIRDTVKLKVKRNGQKITVTVKPVLSKKDGLYKLGNLQKNCRFGVFGKASKAISNPVYSDPIPVGTQDQVEKGKAYILSTLGNNEIHKYEVQIERIKRQKEPDDKSMIIRVTDPELIEESGGIVQGMSGSPIIQNGRIVGAVTHVFVNDAKRGYGIFIQWMLEESADLK